MNPTLRRGSRGTPVRTLQTRLRAHGATTVKADGSFGPATQTAVRNFQKAKSLTVDGIVGANTWRALNASPTAAHDAETKRILGVLGWRVDTPKRFERAVRDFQAAWNFAAYLGVDGNPGPLTRTALATAETRRKNGQGDISQNFSAREFACRCNGANSACHRIVAPRAIVQAAERLRPLIGPFTPYRAYRCPVENARVGGAKKSQHLYGFAIDLGTEKGVYDLSVATVQGLKIASGIGYYTVSGRNVVRHVDLRHVSTTKTAGTVTAPGKWSYGAFGNRSLIAPRPIS